MKVAICGGGNLGLVCGAVLLSGGHTVSLLTGHPDAWAPAVSVSDPQGKIFGGSFETVSSDPQEVIPGAEMVFICQPGYLIERTLTEISPLLDPGAVVGSVVSSTGFFFFAHKILPAQPVFGFQRVPFISRTEEYGHKGLLLGYKSVLNVAMENVKNPGELAQTLSGMFLTPVNLLESFYEAALTNSNPILHTARLYSLWANGFEPMRECALFYSEWTLDASELLISMDQEFMALLDVLKVRKGAVPSLLEYYESTDAASLTDKIKSIAAFKEIKAPMKLTEKGWVPDFKSRYFTEDFPFGLRFIKELAESNGVDCPTIQRVYRWGLTVM